MHVRHIAPHGPGRRAAGARPGPGAHERTAAGSRPGTGLAARLLDTGLAPTAFGAALRRVARPRGAINRRVARADGAAPRSCPAPSRCSPACSRGRCSRAGVDLPVTLVSLERVAASLPTPRTDITWGEATAGAVAGRPGRPAFAFVPLGAHVPLTRARCPCRRAAAAPAAAAAAARPAAAPPGGRRSDPAPADRRRRPRLSRARRAAPRSRSARPPDPVPPVDNAAAQPSSAASPPRTWRASTRPSSPAIRGRSATARSPTPSSEALARTRPAETFALRARAIARDPGRRRAREPSGLRARRPRARLPAADGRAAGRDRAGARRCPGLDLVLPNTVVPLETNSAFVAGLPRRAQHRDGARARLARLPGRPLRHLLRPVLGRARRARPPARHRPDRRLGRRRPRRRRRRRDLRDAGPQRAAAPLPRRGDLRDPPRPAARGAPPDLHRRLRARRALRRLRHPRDADRATGRS